VAARENATSAKNISDLESILNDLMQNAKISESSRLAAMVQQEVVLHLKDKFSHIRGKGVKQAPFYVLLGAQMPALLVETSFISNPRECKRLTSSKYQDERSATVSFAGFESILKKPARPPLNPSVGYDGKRRDKTSAAVLVLLPDQPSTN
jgi:N-acetylmuramoyl-L-alanine amidase